MTKKILAFITLLPLFSCDMFDYHQLDGRSHLKNDSDENGRNIFYAGLRSSMNYEHVRFVFTGDTHRNDNETEAFVKHINQRNDIQFVLHAGDVTDFGYPKEYKWTNNILKKLEVPHIVLIGNHDIPGYGELVYEDFYGKLNFSFTMGDYKFIAINTNRMEYKHPKNIPDFDFLDKEIEDQKRYKGIIIVMHAPPCSDQLNDLMSVKQLRDRLRTIENLYVCLHGHTHRYKESYPIGNNIKFIGCDNIAKRTYLVFDITPEGYSYEVVEF